MLSKLLHTPEGVRDIYSDECARKLAIQDRIHKVFASYGYHDIQTPTFEFFDIFNKERGSVASKNMYKFFDREGYTLVLRPDITPSIARCVAKYYMDEEMPMRFTYLGNTFINNSEHQGKLKETTQMGCELIGDKTSDADAEMIAMSIEVLLKAGLTEFQVEVGHVDFFLGLIEDAKLDDEAKEKLQKLVEIKNYFGMEQFLDELQLDAKYRETFLKLPELFGSIDVLESAKKLTDNKNALAAIERLEKVYSILKDYQLEKYVSFDLGLLGNYNYYTGLVFKGYTYGIGDAVIKGGRYDNLLKQFEKDSPSIGFCVVIDQLMLALSRQKIDIDTKIDHTMVLYTKNSQSVAIQVAKKLRTQNEQVAMIRKNSQTDFEEYKEFAVRNHCDKILYLADSEHIQIVDLKNHTGKTVNTSEILDK